MTEFETQLLESLNAIAEETAMIALWLFLIMAALWVRIFTK